ncbi:MAG: T9SS type A sorting domain-containing protein [Bacteroidetes bacterium]|nr:T9SS type A sorting domain-containing protein [Bacteroidota bacterium]
MSAVNAQCLMQSSSLTERIQKAHMVVEGEVLAKKSFIANNGFIYTANTVLVYKQWGGSTQTESSITVFTIGGQVGDRMEMAEPSLQFNIGDKGLFLLDETSILEERNEKHLGHWAADDLSGFLKYNIITQECLDGAVPIGDIKTETYVLVNELRGSAQLNNGNPSFPQKAAFKKSIVSFSPTTITAGNQQVLTIKGSGFGATQGSVFFADANDGGKTQYSATANVFFPKWTDSEIEVIVPQRAGTGKITVVTASNVSYESSNALTVTYSNLELLQQTPGPNGIDKLYSPVLDGENADGGLTWTFNEDFYTNKPAVVAFMRALESWRCATLVNFSVDTVNTTKADSVYRDNIHTIFWENGKVPNFNSNALGVTYSQWSGCYNSVSQDWHWYLNDVDMVFNPNLSNGRKWNYTKDKPLSSEFHFESVALHELGHAHQLGHIIDKTGVMHYSIANGEQKSTLNATVDVAAGDNIMTKSTVATNCQNIVPMKAINKNTCRIVDADYPTAAFVYDEDSFCGIDTAILINTTKENVDITWLASSTDVQILEVFSTKDTVLVTATKHGSYTITLQADNDGLIDEVEADIHFIEPIVVTDAEITDVSCHGEMDGAIKLKFNKGGFSVQWDDDSELIQRTDLFAGKYSVRVYDKNSNCATRSEFEIKEPAEIKLTTGGTNTWGTLRRGTAWVTVNGGNEPYTYEWSDANKSTTDTITGLAQGIYLIKVTDANNCSAQGTYQVGKAPTSIGELDEFPINLYPNPTSENITLTNDQLQKVDLTIYSATGQKMQTIQLVAKQSTVVDASAWANGIYTATVLVNNQVMQTHIVKQ